MGGSRPEVLLLEEREKDDVARKLWPRRMRGAGVGSIGRHLFCHGAHRCLPRQRSRLILRDGELPGRVKRSDAGLAADGPSSPLAWIHILEEQPAGLESEPGGARARHFPEIFGDAVRSQGATIRVSTVHFVHTRLHGSGKLPPEWHIPHPSHDVYHEWRAPTPAQALALARTDVRTELGRGYRPASRARSQ